MTITANLTVALEEKRSKTVVYLAKFQFDHRFPKSRYPFLCTSFYNLYPTCANCNLAKGKKSTKFDLYTTDPTGMSDVFRFSIDEDSVKKYLEISRSCEDIKVVFKSSDEFDPALADLIKNHKEVFKIQEIYDTQKDVAEELVLKSKLYSEAYKKSLARDFPKLFPDINYINRVLVGNYAQPEEIHKRPMAKYMQDIARDLKIIE